MGASGGGVMACWASQGGMNHDDAKGGDELVRDDDRLDTGTNVEMALVLLPDALDAASALYWSKNDWSSSSQSGGSILCCARLDNPPQRTGRNHGSRVWCVDDGSGHGSVKRGCVLSWMRKAHASNFMTIQRRTRVWVKGQRWQSTLLLTPLWRKSVDVVIGILNGQHCDVFVRSGVNPCAYQCRGTSPRCNAQM